jgi:hypothetical protein
MAAMVYLFIFYDVGETEVLGAVGQGIVIAAISSTVVQAEYWDLARLAVVLTDSL